MTQLKCSQLIYLYRPKQTGCAPVSPCLSLSAAGPSEPTLFSPAQCDPPKGVINHNPDALWDLTVFTHHIHTHAHTHTQTGPHTHPHTYIQTGTGPHTYTHTHTNRRRPTHIHTHAE